MFVPSDLLTDIVSLGSLLTCVLQSTNVPLSQLRTEWGYQYWVTTDAGSVDLLITQHGTFGSRECAAKIALENGISGEMGGGSYTYLTLPGKFPADLVSHSSFLIWFY